MSSDSPKEIAEGMLNLIMPRKKSGIEVFTTHAG
ncbi:hypothetical protein NB694_000725 [Pantoea ananatis]|nr:hypothetical protein [Pantoea ananatis]